MDIAIGFNVLTKSWKVSIYFVYNINRKSHYKSYAYTLTTEDIFYNYFVPGIFLKQFYVYVPSGSHAYCKINDKECAKLGICEKLILPHSTFKLWACHTHRIVPEIFSNFAKSLDSVEHIYTIYLIWNTIRSDALYKIKVSIGEWVARTLD